jgi:pimeloyl-ACP methyl ester carboxylesterase
MRSKLIYSGIILLLGGMAVLGWHEFVFPEIHTHVCEGKTIYQLPREVAIPGYIRGPASRQVVVYIHGIRDDGTHTWRSNLGQYWPALAATEATAWDVYVHQYQDDIPIKKIATHMGIGLAPVFEAHDNVIVVAHSMGGIAIREFLMKNPVYARKVSVLYLLATPSLGSKIANVISRLGLGNKQADDLRTIDVNPFLSDHIRRWRAFDPKVPTVCAYETRKTWLFEVVGQSSAEALCDSDSFPIDAGHSTIVKPDCQDSDVNVLLMKQVHDHSLPAKKPSSVESTFRFVGPFRVARTGDAIVFNLTDAVRDRGMGDRRIRIESATVTAQVSSESNEAFGLDQELLISQDTLQPQPAILGGSALTQFNFLRDSYGPPRRLLQVTIRTDAGRTVHSLSPISWTANIANGSVSSGEMKSVRDTAIDVGPDGLPLQLFLWTLWGGDHYVEFSSIDVKLTVRTTTETN